MVRFSSGAMGGFSYSSTSRVSLFFVTCNLLSFFILRMVRGRTTSSLSLAKIVSRFIRWSRCSFGMLLILFWAKDNDFNIRHPQKDGRLIIPQESRLILSKLAHSLNISQGNSPKLFSYSCNNCNFLMPLNEKASYYSRHRLSLRVLREVSSPNSIGNLLNWLLLSSNYSNFWRYLISGVISLIFVLTACRVLSSRQY